MAEGTIRVRNEHLNRNRLTILFICVHLWFLFSLLAKPIGVGIIAISLIIDFWERVYLPVCHSRENGNPVYLRSVLDSCLRGSDSLKTVADKSNK
jgi:hypothetical protein